MNFPKHIGIIPDGNRTRAKAKDLPSFVGHTAGFDNAKKLVRYCFEQGIQAVTLRGASTENIQERGADELNHLYEIYQTVTEEMIQLHKDFGVGFKWVGSEEGLPTSLVDYFHRQEAQYPSQNGAFFVLAVNYGGQDEILRGIHTFMDQNPGKKPSLADLSNVMDFGSLPPVEFVIRTKGQMAKRLSGFMTRWIGYAELYFSDLYFPDFNVEELKKALTRFDQVVQYRNYGK